MEEIINIVGEQPESDNSTLIAEEQRTEMELENGSPISKFKSVKELGMAYQNLEKEFTQKCQKIKELTDKLSSLENTNVFVPEYEREDWAENVKLFFANHPLAKEYIAEISEVLQKDESVSKQTNSLEVALTKVLANKFVPYTELIKDENFLEQYIYSNQQIGEKFINNYLDGLEKNKAMPLMTSISGSGTFSSPIKKPKTIKDAGKMVEAYFKN
jgi:ribosomal protein L11 methylase PrmA